MGSASAKPEVSPIEGNFKVVEEVDEKSSKVSEIVVETKDVNTHTTDEVDAVSPRMEEGEQSEETLEEVVEPRIIPQQAFASRRIINAPNVCPPGYRMDPFGKCRKIM